MVLGLDFTEGISIRAHLKIIVAIELPSPGLSATLSPSDGKRDGVRGVSFPRVSVLQFLDVKFSHFEHGLHEMIPAASANIVALDAGRESGVFELQQRARRRLRHEPEHNRGVNPLIRPSQLTGRVNVSVNAFPA